MAPLHVAGRTHVGLVRKRNEDAHFVGDHLIAVADGLGGHVAGDVASSTAIDVVRRYDRPVAVADLADTLGQAVDAVNRALRTRISGDPAVAGMGTTLVALLRSGNTAVLANVGDSRAYVLRCRGSAGSRTVQVSEDHIYARLIADAGVVPQLPEKLARFLDGRPDGRSPDLRPLILAPDDRVLLCSDGLSSYVPHDLIHAVLSAESDPATAADRLVAMTLDRGAPDNVTVVIADGFKA